MKVFIDTSARWNSGFFTHIRQLIKNIDHTIQSDDLVFLHGCSKLIDALRPFSEKIIFEVNNTIPSNSWAAKNWRRQNIPILLNRYRPDVHLNLMGWIQHDRKNIAKITMNRNLQPFLPKTVNINPVFSKERLRLHLSRKAMIKSYNRSDGLIFNSEYARDVISPLLKNDLNCAVIPHGVNEAFYAEPRKVTESKSVKLLYVSDFYLYKNHEKVIAAIFQLRKELGHNLELNLIGEMNNDAKKRIASILAKIPDASWIHFVGTVQNDSLPKYMLANDIYVYASSVESFGHSLIEAMAAGMPIACSNKRPMSDFIGDGALTFDEKNIESIKESLKKLILDKQLRARISYTAYNRSLDFSYRKMTEATFRYIRSFV